MLPIVREPVRYVRSIIAFSSIKCYLITLFHFTTTVLGRDKSGE